MGCCDLVGVVCKDGCGFRSRWTCVLWWVWFVWIGAMTCMKLECYGEALEWCDQGLGVRGGAKGFGAG